MIFGVNKKVAEVQFLSIFFLCSFCSTFYQDNAGSIPSKVSGSDMSRPSGHSCDRVVRQHRSYLPATTLIYYSWWLNNSSISGLFECVGTINRKHLVDGSCDDVGVCYCNSGTLFSTKEAYSSSQCYFLDIQTSSNLSILSRKKII